MKNRIFIVLFFVAKLIAGQTFAGYAVTDYLRSAVHPDGCDPLPLTGPPDDSMWVNLFNGQKMTGLFGNNQTAAPGNLLLLESAFNTHSYWYEIRLLYNNSFYTPLVILSPGISYWTGSNQQVTNYNFSASNTCTYQTGTVATYVRTLSIASDFSLTAQDTIKGIELTFAGSNPDIGGIYIGKPQNPVKVQEFQLPADHITLYPNPSSGIIKMTYAGSADLQLSSFEIVNSCGQKIREGILDNFPIEINTADLTTGLYEIRLRSSGGILTRRFFKE